MLCAHDRSRLFKYVSTVEHYLIFSTLVFLLFAILINSAVAHISFGRLQNSKVRPWPRCWCCSRVAMQLWSRPSSRERGRRSGFRSLHRPVVSVEWLVLFSCCNAAMKSSELPRTGATIRLSVPPSTHGRCWVEDQLVSRRTTALLFDNVSMSHALLFYVSPASSFTWQINKNEKSLSIEE